MSSIMKVHSLKGNINNAIDYILDETKTDYWISGTNRGVDPSVVGMYWQSEWKENNYKGTNVGYHFIQSFDEPNLKPEQIYEIAEEWIKDCTHDEHDYVIAVHKIQSILMLILLLILSIIFQEKDGIFIIKRMLQYLES